MAEDSQEDFDIAVMDEALNEAGDDDELVIAASKSLSKDRESEKVNGTIATSTTFFVNFKDFWLDVLREMKMKHSREKRLVKLFQHPA